ncbi:penicillin-binding protein 2 [Bacteroidetes/Chlorobi group bacterium ChocPot_Mid]|jgi:penicillin-binding protein 2|nr:MAG: penicillin-binding protein 2 [Bacteroidetes/Chlorobi group bacterium ChocPot_Mid]
MERISLAGEIFDSKKRQLIYKIMIAAFAVIFIGRLAIMQLLQGDIYRAETETQAIKQVVIEPFRGNMFDRYGRLIVHNEPSFTLTITRSDFVWETLPLLCQILEKDSNEIKQILYEYRTVSKFTPIKIYKDLEFSKVALIEEYNDILSGVDIIVESKRLYDLQPRLAHVLGYNKPISSFQLQSMSYYRPGDIIGQTGLESSYEEQLRGSKGVKYIAVNKYGQKVSSFDNGRRDIPASNGFDIYLTIDTDLQNKIERLLRGWRGAVVAIDPNNGEILAMASSPDFDPRNFSGKISSDIYTSLVTNKYAPMYNRATMSKYSPGSTWKMLMAIAALNEGIIDEKTKIRCNGSIKLGFRTFKCHGAHGPINVRTALKVSCNVFFYELGMRLGLEKIEKYSRMFGFGQKTYVDLPDEKPGSIPTLEWAEKMFGDAEVPKGYLVNFGIGQGEVSATPLQMAQYTATIANKGTLYQPHIVRAVHNNFTDKKEPIAYDSRKLPIRKEIFDIIQKGMYDVVNGYGGTATNASLPKIKVCGKTGTAQNIGRDHSWFVCFAPMDKPKIALCVMIENGGFGNEIAAPMARQILWHYFKMDTLYLPNYINRPVSDSVAADYSVPIRD